MKTTAFFILFAVLFFQAGLVGCAKEKPSEGAVTWVDHGDPSALLKGTSGQSVLTKDELAELVGWNLVHEQVIAQRSTIEALKSQRRNQDPSLRQRGSFVLFGYQIETNKDESSVRLFSRNDQGMIFERDANDEYRLVRFRGRAAKLIHYSRHRQREAVSFLMQLSSNELVAIYFNSVDEGKYHEKDESADKSESRYNFTFPPQGRWRDKTLQIELCSFPNQKVITLAKEAIAKWQVPLDGRLQLQARARNQCLPFSDLNVHTIHWDESYRPAPHSRDLHLGVTLAIASERKQRIIDGDIFLFAGELLKQSKDETRVDFGPMKYALVHEVGHLLGLDHQFNPKIKSVMGYDGEIVTLQDYDIKAIQTLYPRY